MKANAILLSAIGFVALPPAAPVDHASPPEESGCWYCQNWIDPVYGYIHTDNNGEISVAGPGLEDEPHQGFAEDPCSVAHNLCFWVDEAAGGQPDPLQALSASYPDSDEVQALLSEVDGTVTINHARSAVQVTGCGDRFVAHIPVEGEILAGLGDRGLLGGTR